MEKKPIWQVPKEEGHSRESAETATRNVDTRERIVLFERRHMEDPEVEAMANNAHTVVERVTTKTRAGNYIQTRHHNGSGTRRRRPKQLEQVWR